VVWRHATDGPEVLLVHRPKYDDWTLPKGKAEPGEDDHTTALREVREETGCVCTLGAELPSTHYVDNQGRQKVVRYWAMTVASADPWAPDDEVDELRWVKVPEARTLLSYDRDLTVLDAFVAAA
jgi:8-oxo-dGTP diphosphatase